MVLRSPLVLSNVCQHRLRYQLRLSRNAKRSIAPNRFGDPVWPPIKFVNKASTVVAAGPNLVQNVPGGVRDGDQLIWVLSLDNSSLITVPPSGWNSLFTAKGLNGGTVDRAWAYSRIASSEPASYSVGANVFSTNWTSTMLCYRAFVPYKSTDFPFSNLSFITYGSASSYATQAYGLFAWQRNNQMTISCVFTSKALPQVANFDPDSTVFDYLKRDTVIGASVAHEVSDKFIKATGGTVPAASTSFSDSSFVPTLSAIGVVFTIGIYPPTFYPLPLRMVRQAVNATFPRRKPRGRFKRGKIATGLSTQAPVTGVFCTGQVGTLTFACDMNFTLARGLYRLNPCVGFVGSPNVRVDSSPAVVGVQGVGSIGVVVYRSSVSPAGLSASGVLGSITTRTDFSFSAVGFAALGRVGTPGFQNTYAIAGVQGAGAVGTPIVLVPNFFTGPSVAGAGQVGVVGFRIDCNVSPIGVFGTMILGSVAERVDSTAAPIGLAAAGQVGSTAYEVRYGVAGVQGAGQVGISSPTYGVPVAGVRAVGQVGIVRVGFDTTVNVTGVYGTGIVGQQEVPLRLVKVKADKMIYTRAPHS